MIYENVILEAKSSINKKYAMKRYFLDTYNKKYDSSYEKDCDHWDKGKISNTVIQNVAEFYYIGYTESDIIKLAKNNNINRYTADDIKNYIPKLQNKTFGEILNNGAGDELLYCFEDKKIYIYLHEGEYPDNDPNKIYSISFKELMQYSKSEVINNPIYKERYKNK